MALSVLCFAVWIAPTRFAPELTRWILLTMLLEFVVVHSSAFMGQFLFSDRPPAARALSMLGLGAFYTLFVGGFALAFHSVWPLVSFWLLTLNRMSAVLLHGRRRESDRAYLNATWAGHVMCYLAGAGLTLVPFLPRLGLTAGVVASLHLPGSGLWISQPWRVVAFAAFYFGGVAALECVDFRPLLAGAARAAAGTSAHPA
jgi:hypothetical protein